MVEQHVDHVFEEVRLLGREEATLDLVNGLLQLWELLVILLGVVPGEKKRGPLLRMELDTESPERGFAS